MCIHVYVIVSVCVYECVQVYMCVSMCAGVCVYVCVNCESIKDSERGEKKEILRGVEEMKVLEVTSHWRVGRGQQQRAGLALSVSWSTPM